MNDLKIFKWLLLILLVPIVYVVFGQDRFRYPCQDPANWDSPQCQLPVCDVTRTCPEHIFKGQRDPRLGPPTEQPQPAAAPAPAETTGCINVK
jgi:hypothetical protein